MTESRTKIACLVAVALGIGGVLSALLLLGLAFQQFHIPELIFAGRGTHPHAPAMLVPRLDQVFQQWQLLLAAISVFQLLLGPALIVGALRTFQEDVAGRELLRLTAKLALLFELLRLAPLMLVYIDLWRTIRDFFPGQGSFPQLPGIDLAPALSEAQAGWLTTWMVCLMLVMLTWSIIKLMLLWLVWSQSKEESDATNSYSSTIPSLANRGDAQSTD